MSERKINLEEIIKLYSLSDTITTRQSFIYFGKQLLELAAENAEITRKDYFEATIEEAINGFDVYHNWDTDDCPSFVDIINVDSILDTIKQVE